MTKTRKQRDSSFCMEQEHLCTVLLTRNPRLQRTFRTARYKNIVSPKRREFGGRLRPAGRLVPPLGRPVAAIRSRLRHQISDRRSIESSLHQFVGPRLCRRPIRLQVPAKLAIANDSLLL